YTRSMVRIFHRHNLVAVHKREYGIGKYTTAEEHLCSTHRHYQKRNPEYYKDKAANLSKTLGELVRLLFARDRYPEQLYKSCDGLLKLFKSTPRETFDKACQMAIDHQNLTYGFALNVIKNKMTEYIQKEQPDKDLPRHNNIRGKEYYDNQLSLKF
ncbi:hypothetical protein SAMN06265379_11541, partial [Saccharicrinis carchari]